MTCISLVGEFDNQGSGENSPVCARQPRTLSMAIVPGEHIRAIALAKQQTHTEQSGEINSEANTPDSTTRNQTECTSTS